MTLFGEVGEVITPLNAALLVETAQTVADEEKAEGHRAATKRGHRMGQAPPEDNRV
jgi:hypothetical protein